MNLYLVQHADAKNKEEDPARPLSKKGFQDLEKVSSFLEVKGIRVTKILHSGKLRAKQTAEILNEVIPSSEGVMKTEGLAPLDDPYIWGKRSKEESNDLMLVGHLPNLRRLAGLLLTDNADKRVIDFKKGGVLCLQRDEEDNWSVGWMIIP